MIGGYNPDEVQFKKCLMCHQFIANEPWEEVDMLARFGQMLFAHVICPTKILFLDIDGVCNSGVYARSLGKGGMLGIDPVAAARVRRIIAETGCKVVLSSTWRLDHRNRKQVAAEVCALYDQTKNLRGSKRGVEVRDWVFNHSFVEKYAILDDDADFYSYQPLFKTSFETGLTDEIADAVIAHLNSA